MPHVICDPVPDLPRPLGRLTEATMDLWSNLSPALPRVPKVFRGEVPSVGPDLSRFDYGYPDDAEQGAEEDEAHYYQVRGFCVGWATAQAFQIVDSLPAKITDRSRWTRGRRLSPLYSYALSRWYAAKVAGVNLGGGDGAIVSHAVLAASKYGVLPWDAMPCTRPIEQAHSNRSFPDDAMRQTAGQNALANVGLVESPEKIVELLLTGVGPILVGTPIRRGMMQTGSDGSFDPLQGGTVGGHAYVIVQADREKDLALVKNSWPQWGKRLTGSAAKRYAGSGGYTNLGVCKLSRLMQLLSASMLRSGQSEAFCPAGLRGFVPRVEIPG